MIAILNISLLLMAMFLTGCGDSKANSQGVSSSVLVSRILAERETETTIARCLAVVDYTLNEKRISLPREGHQEHVAVQFVWFQAAQVKTDSPLGPNSGRVSPNHFKFYSEHQSEIKSVSSLDDILSEFSSCSNQVEKAAGGFETLLRVSK